MNIWLLIQTEQKPSNLLRSIHHEPYLPMSPLGSQPLPLGASRHAGLRSAGRLSISPLRAASQHYPRSPPWPPATSGMAPSPSPMYVAIWAMATATTRAEHTNSAWLQERRTFVFFYGTIMKPRYRNAASSSRGSKTEISKENISDPLPGKKAVL